MNIKISVPMVIEPQATRYHFFTYTPLRIGDIADIVVQGDNDYKPWAPRPFRTRRVILLADASGRQWLVECR